MSKWVSIKQLSEQYGVEETVLRRWTVMGYITSSKTQDVLMLEEDSLNSYLDLRQRKWIGEEALEERIKQKKLEREVLLSQLEDELFLLKTQQLYQPLFHTVIQELGELIMHDEEREIFLAISGGEPISKVAKRYEMTYAKTTKIYSSLLAKLDRGKGKIAIFRKLAMKKRFGDSIATNPTKTLLLSILQLRGYNVLCGNLGLYTVEDLLQYISRYGWQSLRRVKGMGATTYRGILDDLEAAGFIIQHVKGEPELTPEIAALIV